MKALSLWQPWASAWLSPIKINETRPRICHHHGDLLVHAAKTMADTDVTDEFGDLLCEHFGNGWIVTMPRGALIGVVKIIACRSTNIMPPEHRETPDWHAGNFSPNRYAIERATEFVLFKTPIPWRGQQFLFDVPYEAVQAAIEAAR